MLLEGSGPHRRGRPLAIVAASPQPARRETRHLVGLFLTLVMLRPMQPALSIVTGTSRGLGFALASALLARGDRVLSIARGTPSLTPSARLEHWRADLADPGPVAARLHAWLRAQDPAELGVATLINNAGTIASPASLEDADDEELARAIRVGLEAPLLLTAAFLRATDGWPLRRRILLVSSGLGRRGMAGVASYCAAKAGLDNLARAVALEQAARAHGARIASVAPGVIDTDMQRQLRDADARLFGERERFAALHRDGALDSPAHAADRLLRLLDREDFGQPPVADVRDP